MPVFAMVGRCSGSTTHGNAMVLLFYSGYYGPVCVQ